MKTKLNQLWAVLLLTLGAIVSSCSDLSVFLPQGGPLSLNQVTSLTINEEGKLALEWNAKEGSEASTYQIYLMEVKEDDKEYQFTTQALYDAPLRKELLSLAQSKAPKSLVKPLDTTTSFNFVISQLLVPGKRYILEIGEKGRRQGFAKSKAFLIEADFAKPEGASAQLSDGAITLTWNHVAGANAYEIFADEARTILLGTTPVNNISINVSAANNVKKFYVRALKGELAARDQIEVILSESNLSLLSLKSLKPNGLYGKGEILDFEAKFSGIVTAYGDVFLPLIFDQGTDKASYLSGSGTDTLIFRYTIPSGKDSLRLQNGSAFIGQIVDVSGTDLPAILPSEGSGSLKDSSFLKVDTTAPTGASSVGFAAAASLNGNSTVSWLSSYDRNFDEHRFKLCSNSSCTMGCSAETAVSGSTMNLSGLSEGQYYACVQGVDLLEQKSAWIASTQALLVDLNAPTVARVYSPLSSGYVKAGDQLDIVVEYNEPVFVAGTGLELDLNLGAPNRSAIYQSGSGSTSLHFQLLVASGDNSNDLNYTSVNAMSVGSAAISDLSGHSAVTSLPATADSHALAGQNAIVVDTTVPLVPAAVSVPASHSNVLNVPVAFTAGTDAHFKQNAVKLCSANDCSTGCTSAVNGSSPVTIAGSNNQTYYACVRSEDQSGNVSNWIASSGSIALDNQAPSVSGVSSSTADGAYKAGQSLSIQVTFTESVALTTSSDIKLNLNLGGTARQASYVSGAPGSVLTFSYTILAGDESADLSYVDVTSLVLGTATIRDAALNNAVLQLPAPGAANSLNANKQIVVDAVLPTNPSNVEFPAAILSSTTIPFTWSASVDTRLDHYNTKVCAAANCLTSCSSVITSTSTAVNHSGTDGSVYYACVQAADLLGNTSAWVSSATSVSLDLTGAGVTHIDSPTADGIYKAGEAVLIDVHFSEAVTVANGADLRLLLETGITDRSALYLSGSGTTALRFRYLPVATDASEDLDYQSTSALSLGGTGSIVDSVSNPAILNLPALGGGQSLAANSDIIIDTTAPSLPSAISFPTTTSGSTSFTVNFTGSSDAHFLTHNIKLCSSNDCSSSCGVSSSSITSPASLSGSNGSTYFACVQGEDSRGHQSAFVSSTNSLRVDTTAPTVTSVVSSHADGSFKAGEIILVEVIFSEDIQITNASNLNLLMETGSTDRLATYSSQPAVNKIVFSYTVQAGDTSPDLDYQSMSALGLGASGTIKDLAGNNATLTLPALGTAQSLAGSKIIIIDTTLPSAPVISSPASAAFLTSNLTTVSGTTAESGAFIEVKSGGTTIASGNATAGTWSLTLASPLSDGSYTISATARDLAGNVSPASSSVSFVVDTSAPVAPTVSALSTPTLDSTPAVAGTSEPSMTIEVFANGLSVGTTTANGTGVWSLNSSVLSDGNYNITAVASDPGNRSSSASTAVPISIDTTSPTVPTVVTFPNGSPSSSTSMSLSWTASTDAHLKQYNTKLCAASSCTGSCTALTSSTGTATTATQLGVDGQSYYACVQAEDVLGHFSAWTASAATVLIDASGATITNVNAASGSAFYKTADTVDINIVFNETVNVLNSGDLRLLLETGATDRNAVYQSGSGSTTLVFRYSVVAGDTAADLDVQSVNALSLGAGGSIKDTAGNNATLTLPPLGGGSSIAGQANVVIDTTAPGNPISIGFSGPYSTSTSVPVTWAAGTEANPDSYSLKLCTASSCASGCGAVTTVTGLSGSAVGLDGQAYYACVQAIDEVAQTSAWANSSTQVTIDATLPSVSRVFALTSNGSYRATQTIQIVVEFTEAVAVINSGDLGLTLESGTTDRVAVYNSKPAPNQIRFDYTIVAGDSSTDLDYLSAGSLSKGSTGAINDLAGNAATLTLPTVASANSLGGQSNIVIDTAAPAAPAISSHSDGQYVVAAITTISGSSEANAQIELRNGSTVIGTTTAVGTSWSITLSTPLSDGVYGLNARATDAAGNISSASATRTVTVDTSAPTAPVVSAITTPTTSTTPTVSGTSEPNVGITIYSGSTAIGTTTANGSGAWTLTSNTLVDGTHSITAKATDLGGRDSVASNVRSVAIDTVNPTPPSSLAFASPTSTTAAVNFTFTPSTDTHFTTHNVKLCTVNDCSSCTGSTTSVASPATVTGSNGGTYFACAQGVDSLGHLSAWVASAGTVAIDTAVPTVLNVNGSTTNGFYKAGTVIGLTVTFSESVTVSNGADIGLDIETGTVDQRVIYTSGSPGAVLTFNYTVQAGDTAADLDYKAINSLTLGSTGLIKDAAGNSAVLTLPAVGATNSLGSNRNYTIDTTAPTAVTSILLSGAYSSSTSFTASWSGASDLNLNRHDAQICANSTCSSGCTSYQTINLPALSATFTGLANTTYWVCIRAQDAANNSSIGAKSATSITIDTSLPSVTGVTSSKADGTYKVGELIPITVTFSENVTVLNPGDVTLTLETGSTDRAALYSSGSGSQNLIFNYTVQTGDTSADLDYVATTSLSKGSTGTIRDAAGNDATLTLVAPGASGSIGQAKAIVIDTTAPIAPVITSPSAYFQVSNVGTISGTSESNATIEVKVNGTVRGTVVATGTTWTYTLGTALSDGDYTLSANATDGAGNKGVDSTGFNIRVDNSGPAAPTMNAITTPTNTTTPTVSGLAEANSTVKIYAGATLKATTTADGAGNYSVAMSALAEGTYTITATATDGGNRTSSASSGQSITIDTTVPTVTNVTSSAADGTYGIGATIPIQIVFSSIVNVTGTPILYIQYPGIPVNYASGSGTNTLTFNYVPAAGQSFADLSYHDSFALALNAGTIRDTALNNATLAMAAPGSANSLSGNKNIVIDAIQGTVTGVNSSNADGKWGPGNVINIAVTFSKAMTVAVATPTLTLNTSPSRTAAYANGTGTTVLNFTYTVQAGDTSADLNYASTGALTLNTATIKDSVGNNAVLTLPGLAAAGSLGTNKNLNIVGSNTAPNISPDIAAQNGYTGSPISTVNVNHSNGTDTDSDSEAITYSCKFDRTVNGSMDSGGTACASLPNSAYSFNTATGIFTWTPSLAAASGYGGYTAKTRYEFEITGNDTANMKGTTLFTVDLIIPFSQTMNYRTSTASDYSYDSSKVIFGSTSVSLAEIDTTDDDNTLSGFAAGGNYGVSWDMNAQTFFKLDNAGGCDGRYFNCGGKGDRDWVPQASDLVSRYGFDNTFEDSVRGATGTFALRSGGATPAFITTTVKTGDRAVDIDSSEWMTATRPVGDDFTLNYWMNTLDTITSGSCAQFFDGAGLVSAEVPGTTNDFGTSLCGGKIIAGVGNPDTSVVSANTVNDSKWHMVTMSRKKSTGQVILYVDGIENGRFTSANVGTLSGSTTIGIGAASATDGRYYTGKLDELMIWRSVLTQADIWNLYYRQASFHNGEIRSRIIDTTLTNSTLDGFSWTTRFPYGKELMNYDAGLRNETTATYPGLAQTSLMNNLVGLWHFNETSANGAPSAKDFKDDSGQNNHATDSGTVAYGSPGRLSGSLLLKGAGSLNLGPADVLSFGSSNFSAAFWVKTNQKFDSSTSSRIISNGFTNALNGWMVQLRESHPAFGIGCNGGTAANCTYIKADKPINDGAWHHVAVVADRTNSLMKIFVDGVQRTASGIAGVGDCGAQSGMSWSISGCSTLNANRTFTDTLIGMTPTNTQYFWGQLDELAIWSKALSAADIKELYIRGGVRMGLQVRTCDDANCVGESWSGPDGTNQTYFTEVHNNTAPTTALGSVKTTQLSVNFSNFSGQGLALPTGRWFQYKMFLENEDFNNLCNYGAAEYCSPEVTSVTLGLSSYYNATQPTIVSENAIAFYSISSMTESLGGASCAGGVRYQLSVNKTNWFYWTGTAWAASNNTYAQANPIATVNSQASLFAGQVGRTSLYIKAILNSNGKQACELQNIIPALNQSH